ncbi:hypothetical protein PsorP6_008378 [Peronosclerospora sorghi]|uniref:Uncharacterized protein n=1 Tax=Peronosclerospora sorghi TaxID=230839 RepID=A0ACC0W8C0_9STRA|nr:hypothetical protein PsorP6_008378 [Peronosclerospora sorghi]
MRASWGTILTVFRSTVCTPAKTPSTFFHRLQNANQCCHLLTRFENAASTASGITLLRAADVFGSRWEVGALDANTRFL